MPQWVLMVSPVAWLSTIVAVAIALIAFGWRGRRIGREPRCRRCRYELTQLASDTCPECGLKDVMRRPRFGVRRVRWICFGFGWLILFAIGAAAGWIWRNPMWRSAAPMPLLTAALDFGDTKAAFEIFGRLSTNRLSAWEKQHLIARAIAAQRYAALDSKALEIWVELLGHFDRMGLLSDADWETASATSVRDFRVVLRTRTRVGDRIRLQPQADFASRRFGNLEGRIRIRPLDWRQAAGEWVHCAPHSEGHAFRLWRQQEYSLPHNLPVGRHLIEVEFEGSESLGVASMDYSSQTPGLTQLMLNPLIRPSRRNELDQFQARCTAHRECDSTEPLPPEIQSYLHMFRFTQRAEIEVFPADSDDDFQHLRGPEIIAAVKKLIQFEPVVNHPGQPAAPRVRLRLVEPPPWPLGFDVLLCQKDRQWYWGPIFVAAGDARLWDDLAAWELSRLEAGPVWVELVPSTAHARDSMDMRFVNEWVELGPVEYAPAEVTDAHDRS